MHRGGGGMHVHPVHPPGYAPGRKVFDCEGLRGPTNASSPSPGGHKEMSSILADQ
jgi:hypothetical protein